MLGLGPRTCWRFAILALFLAASLPVGPAAAEDAPDPSQISTERLVEAGVRHLARRVELTEEQKQEVRPILQDYVKSWQGIPARWNQTWRKRAQYNLHMQRFDQQRAARIERVLTEAQLEKYRALREQRDDYLMPAPPKPPKQDRSARK